MINFRLKNAILANLQTFFITNSKIMKKRPDLILPLILMMTFYWTSCQRTADPDVAVTGMRTDYTLNPTGIDHSRPQLTWQLSDNRTGAAMTAFRVLVATSPELLQEGKADMWDSGRQKDGLNYRVRYAGKPLQPSTRYFWKVQAWDKDNKLTAWSEPVMFETAYLDPGEWSGKWITHTEDIGAKPAPMFRKVLQVSKKLKKATAYVAGAGYHDLYINNRKVSDTFLQPGYTRFDRRTLYVTYDITPFLEEGSNGMGVILGNGWYNVQTVAVWYFEKSPWRKTPRLMMDIRLEYEDGTVEVVGTDASWKFAEGPLRFNSLYGGEYYDARLEAGEWTSPGYDDATWTAALVTEAPGGLVSAQFAPPIRVVKEITPAAVHELGRGRYLFDLGENIAGIARLKVSGPEGTRITMRFGERIDPDKSLNVDRIAEHMRIPAGEHPFQTNVYILKGDGVETYTPSFTYHGFQYIEVLTEPALELDAGNLTGLFLSTGFEEAGSFRCSDELLNRLYEATMSSYLGNFHSIPTDCPHREKNGWTGDAHIAAELGLWNFQGMQPYRKWLQDLRDEQRESGELPGIVPTSGWGYHWGNGPAWDSALPIIAWALYEFYGDAGVLEENYEAVKRYVDYLGTRAENHLINIGLGDWVSIAKTPVQITSTGYYHHDAVLLSKMAGILGKKEDQAAYAQLAEEIRNAFNEAYLDRATNRYKVQTQTALSCAVFQGLVPDDARDQAVADLVGLIVANNYHPDFGLLGSKYVINVLREAGHNDVAYRMISNREYPSWGHWIEQGATTLWEDWQGGASLNHIFLGDFTTWYYKALGGIEPDPAHPGFEHFFLKPVFADDLSFAETSHMTVHGRIVSNWKRDGDQVEMSVVIPPGCSATYHVPAGYILEKAEAGDGRKSLRTGKDTGSQELSMPSGRFTITLKKG